MISAYGGQFLETDFIRGNVARFMPAESRGSGSGSGTHGDKVPERPKVYITGGGGGGDAIKKQQQAEASSKTSLKTLSLQDDNNNSLLTNPAIGISGSSGSGIFPNVGLLGQDENRRPFGVLPSKSRVVDTSGKTSLGLHHQVVHNIPAMSFPDVMPTVLKPYKSPLSNISNNGSNSSSGSGSRSSGSSISISSSNNSNVCPICQRRFTRPWLLKGHMRMHTGERPFLCSFPLCEKAFADKSNLRSHMQTHTALTKNFECGRCGRAFSQKRYLHKHTTEVCKHAGK